MRVEHKQHVDWSKDHNDTHLNESVKSFTAILLEVSAAVAELDLSLASFKLNKKGLVCSTDLCRSLRHSPGSFFFKDYMWFQVRKTTNTKDVCKPQSWDVSTVVKECECKTLL